jgi:hypothetical protein
VASTSPERRYSAPADEVFAAARRSAEGLGYIVFEADPERRTLSFGTAPRAAFGADQPITVEIVPDGVGSRVVMVGTLVRTALASRGRLMWNGERPASNRFFDALARDLLAPPAGWLDDPSGRFAQRWWDGSDWTSAARDHDMGVQYEDPPGSLPPPWSIRSRAAASGPASGPTPTRPALAWRADRVAGA